jgi:CRP/FNR family transcriptional regulator, cyclic AMP receptor protein
MALDRGVRITLTGLEHTLRLLVIDPDLASTIQNSARRRAAVRAVTAGDLTLAPGQQPDRKLIESEGTLGVVVLSGFLVREWSAGGHISADLLGPDDVAHPWGGEPMIAMLRHTVSWTALTPARLALLDREFFERAARWPEIAAALLERAGRLGQRLSLRGAIETFSVDARLLMSFWLWASQWATVAGQGVVLRVPLSHERIARLIHARRPTVTSALGRLRSIGLVTQRRDGAWLLKDPALNGNGDRDEQGISMPVIGEMLHQRLGVRANDASLSSDEQRASYRRELRERLDEQRATLRAAAQHHEEMLERLRKETGRLGARLPTRVDE